MDALGVMCPLVMFTVVVTYERPNAPYMVTIFTLLLTRSVEERWSKGYASVSP